MLNPVTSDALSTLEGIDHAFFTREGGISNGIYRGLNAGLGSGDARIHVVENRLKMAEHLRASGNDITSPYQVHSPDVAIAAIDWATDRPKVDAVVTQTPGLAIGVVTADCGPVLFADPNAGIIGAAHAGWKGAIGGVLENTIETMEKLGADRDNIQTVLGPMISQENYEVGPDFPRPFLASDAANERFFVPSRNVDHHMFDLPAFIIYRLQQAGVAACWSGHCTYADEDRFYSYRRTTHRKQEDYGRQMSAIILGR